MEQDVRPNYWKRARTLVIALAVTILIIEIIRGSL